MSSDRLTGLPEEIVSHILSLMPTKYAVRTSLLSKSWRYTWTNVNSLNFDDTHPIHDKETFTKFVDQALKLLKTSQLRSFQLHFFEFPVEISSVSSWINEAVKLNVNELDIQVMQLGLPLSVFTCKTLTKLRILTYPFDMFDWEILSQVNLPCLKTLDVVIYYSNPCVSAFKLIKGCPVLENLFLRVMCISIEDDYQFNIPTLKQLKVTWLGSSNLVKNVVLNVPNLEYLFVRGNLCPVFEMKDASSLVEASISFNEIKSYHSWVEVMKRLVGVKSLSVRIRSSLINVKTMVTSPLPIFPNLNHLELKELWHTGLVFQFLESCPELKHLCIEKYDLYFEDPKEYSWVEQKLVPACMLTKLTYIKFSPGLWWKRHLPFLKYMLGNAKVLKKVTITTEKLPMKDLIQLFEELPKFPRASRCCEIHYHR